MSRASQPVKPCQTCGRDIHWRKKWERDWEQVRYCSNACRRGLTAVDKALETGILELLAGVPSNKSICPSEAVLLISTRQKGTTASVEPSLHEASRRAARRLVIQGKVEIVQAGRVVDPTAARGAIRIRRKS